MRAQRIRSAQTGAFVRSRPGPSGKPAAKRVHNKTSGQHICIDRTLRAIVSTCRDSRGGLAGDSPDRNAGRTARKGSRAGPCSATAAQAPLGVITAMGNFALTLRQTGKPEPGVYLHTRRKNVFLSRMWLGTQPKRIRGHCDIFPTPIRS